KKQDLVDCEAQLQAASRIACSVTAIRKDAPNAHIYFIAHSAGCRVVLAAAEMLPAKSLDRIILLSPAISQTYARPTPLTPATSGVDNFYSTMDWVLDQENSHYRNADGAPGHAAGKFGFRLPSEDKETVAAYRGVRQYAWNEEF